MSEDFSVVARASLNCPPPVSFRFQAILINGSPPTLRSPTDEKDEILAKRAAGELAVEEASNLLDELDIANHKRTEEDLAQNQALLQATIDNLPFDFFAIGLDRRYILQNAVSKALWGIAIGKRPEEICPNEEDLGLWMENNRRAFSGERVDEDVSLLCHGEKRFYNNILTAIHCDGTMYGILGMNVDITERKRVEVVLEEANNELEQRVAERTAELTKTNERLRQTNAELQTIYNGIFEGLLVTDIRPSRLHRPAGNDSSGRSNDCWPTPAVPW